MLLWNGYKYERLPEPVKNLRKWETPIHAESEEESNLVLIVVILLIGIMIGMAGGAAIKVAWDLGQEMASHAKN